MLPVSGECRRWPDRTIPPIAAVANRPRRPEPCHWEAAPRSGRLGTASWETWSEKLPVEGSNRSRRVSKTDPALARSRTERVSSRHQHPAVRRRSVAVCRFRFGGHGPGRGERARLRIEQSPRRHLGVRRKVAVRRVMSPPTISTRPSFKASPCENNHAAASVRR